MLLPPSPLLCPFYIGQRLFNGAGVFSGVVLAIRYSPEIDDFRGYTTNTPESGGWWASDSEIRKGQSFIGRPSAADVQAAAERQRESIDLNLPFWPGHYD